MALKIVGLEPTNYFEKEIFRLCTNLSLEGTLATNVFIPNNENGLDEQDIVVITDHAIYTIDAKGYAPGEYIGGLNTPLKYKKRGEEQFQILNSRLSKPLSTAAYKTKILVSVLNKIIKNSKNISMKFIPRGLKIVSIIVVPDHAGFSGETLEKNEALSKAHCTYKVIQSSKLCKTITTDYSNRLFTKNEKERAALLNELGNVIGDFLDDFKSFSEDLDSSLIFKEKLCDYEEGIAIEEWRGIKDKEEVFVRKFKKYPWRECSSQVFRHIELQVRALNKARFPRVVALLEDHDYPDCYLMVYEWYKNEGTLDEAIKGLYGLSENDALKFIIELATTVHQLHTNPGREKIIIRSLEPSNILLSKWRGEVDWGNIGFLLIGFDKAMVQGRSSIGAEGKSPYEAPEIRLYSDAKARGSVAVDIYSLGKIFFFLLCGEEPEFDKNLNITGINPDIMEIIEKCTEQNPKKRYESVQELIDCLERSLSALKLS